MGAHAHLNRIQFSNAMLTGLRDSFDDHPVKPKKPKHVSKMDSQQAMISALRVEVAHERHR